jgi:hypothetical protein
MKPLFMSLWVVVVVAIAVVACRGSDVKPDPSKASVPSTAASAAATASSSQTKLARIVFVDKEKCCQCTQDRIDASWTALQAALAGRKVALPVDRVHVDTQPEQAAKYRNKQPFTALPAIYLLDGSGNVVELLLGELTQAQVSAALERP